MSAERLLLRAALLEGDAALDAWELAKGRPGLIDAAPYRVLPQLYRNLSALGVKDEETERLKGVYRHCWTSNQRLLSGAGEGIRALHAEGIATLVLSAPLRQDEGVALPLLRLDLLVHAPDVRRAVATLDQAGWEVLHPDQIDRLIMSGDPVAVDWPGTLAYVQTGPFWEPAPEEPVWQAARPIQVTGVDTLTLDPAHQLMRACTAGLAVPPEPERWIPDAVAVLRASRAEIDWDRLSADAEGWHMSARLADALGTLRSEFRQDVPRAVLDRLDASRRSLHERAAQAARRRMPRGTHHVLQWHRHRGLRDARPGATVAFPRYWRASLGADSWSAVAGRYARRLRSR